ncbi:hypothetical protein KIL84_004843 [Mauremys mutica]|uniref:Uncharacterized protein n=1 Tax=Mauremys mutica TaxID=74926 RepID=A0A9D3XPV0_9SAUR|nr:hypothetical protein KIL84_004843 [Mauremys mutica]
MEWLVHPEFWPTPNNMLRVRLCTSGTVETHFGIKDLVFWLYDVGGQHTECWKGLGCFEDMQAVLFVASLSAYDEALSEEPVLNQLQESMKLFSSVCNTMFFQSTSLVSPSKRHHKGECRSTSCIDSGPSLSQQEEL